MNIDFQPTEPIHGDTARSWIIVSKTGSFILETFSSQIVDKINTEKYMVFTARDYLGQLNTKIKLNTKE